MSLLFESPTLTAHMTPAHADVDVDLVQIVASANVSLTDAEAQQLSRIPLTRRSVVTICQTKSLDPPSIPTMLKIVDAIMKMPEETRKRIRLVVIEGDRVDEPCKIARDLFFGFFKPDFGLELTASPATTKKWVDDYVAERLKRLEVKRGNTA